MLLEPSESLIIVSDFHLTGGSNPQPRMLRRREDFFSDAAFANFLNDLIRRASAENRKWRLLLLGDIFDFLHIPTIAGRTTSEIAQAKLEWIAAGHSQFFEGLGRFVSSGFPLDVVPGNHDIELILRPVQQQLVKLLAQYGNQANMTIHFYPWIYYIPGYLYAEHGQQRHDLNTFPMLLELAQSDTPHKIELPPGSHLDSYLYALLDHIAPEEECTKPLISSLRRAVQAHPLAVLTALRHHFSFFKEMATQTIKLSIPHMSTSYDRDVLLPYAAEIGLSGEILVALNRLSSVTTLSILKRLISKTVHHKGDYLQQAALEISGVLGTENLNVPYLVFGHNHTAKQVQLSPNTWYLNTGTWTSLPSPECTQLHEAKHLTFVEVTQDSNTATPTAQLMLWDDTAGQCLPFG